MCGADIGYVSGEEPGRFLSFRAQDADGWTEGYRDAGMTRYPISGFVVLAG